MNKKGLKYISKLYEKLQDIAREENIPYIIDDATFEDEENNVRGYIYFNIVPEDYFSYDKDDNYIPFFCNVEYKDFAIFSRNFDDIVFRTFVLAHELGHYFSITLYGDRSEDGANYESYRICKKILDRILLRRDYFVDRVLDAFCEIGTKYSTHEDLIEEQAKIKLEEMRKNMMEFTMELFNDYGWTFINEQDTMESVFNELFGDTDICL